MKRAILFLTISLILVTIIGCTPGATPLPKPNQPEGEAQTVKEEVTPPADTATPKATPTPTLEPEPLPPLVVRTSPERGEEQPLAAPIEIEFDQPMDRDSVEKAFAIEPGASVDGVFEWPNDRTLRFSLNDGFKRGERYRMRIIESARSAAGLEMQRSFELRFNAIGFLEVTDVQPPNDTAEVMPHTIVTVSFNRPVVPLTAIEDAAGLPDPLTFVPPVTGQGQWLNTSIYQFIPDEGFTPSTQYRARVTQGLTDVTGNTMLEDDFEWSFTTFNPAVIGSIPAEGDIYVSPTPVISLTFNQPMDRSSVEENFALHVAGQDEAIPGEFTWTELPLAQPTGNEDNFYSYYDYAYAEGEGPAEMGVETVTFTPNVTLGFDQVYVIELPKGTLGKIKGAETMSNFTANFTVTPYPKIIETYPADGDDAISPWEDLEVTFSGPMNPDTLVVGENLIIEPTVSVTQVYTYWRRSNTQLTVSFPTEASSQYQVTFGADIEGRYGQRLGASTNIAWETRAKSPLLYMHSPGRLATYNAYTDTLAYVTVRNLSAVDFELYRLPPKDFISLNGDYWWDAWDNYQPDDDNLLSEWTLETSPPLNQNIIYRVDLAEESGLGNGDTLPPGLYYLTASYPIDSVYPEAQGDYYTGYERQMLVVTNNNITLKAAGSESLAWVTDLQSGQPVEDVPITFVASEDESTAPEEIDQAATQSDGVALTTYNRREAYETRFAFAGDPDDPDENFGVTVSNWSDGIERYEFDNVSTEDYQQPYNAHFYTDRNIYRPGQTVNFKGIIRADDDANYSLPKASRTVQVFVSDSQGKEIFNKDLPLSEMGTVHGSFDLDENAALGFYSIQAVYDEENYFYGDFQVAAYRKPEFLVEVTTDKPEYTQGEKIKVTAAAEFFFGGPVSNAQVRWTLLSDDYFFRYQGKGWYDFTDYDFSRRYQDDYVYGYGETIAEGEGVTDKDGRFTFEVEADIADKIASQRFTFDVVITDINNQEVASQAEAVVHKGLFYIGLRPEKYVGRVGEESQMNVLVVDWDSEPVANQEVQVVFSEHNWYSVQKQYEDGSFYWDSVVEDIPVFTTTVTTNQEGQALAGFSPEEGGIYKILATGVDRQRNEVRSSTYMWVSGRKYVNWRQENNDRIELVADQREYNVGDTATILIPHPYSGTVQALITLERGHVYKHWVQELKTNSEQIEIPITEDMIPNMYVSVVVVQGAADAAGGSGDGLPSFKIGYASLPINTGEKELQITLTPDKPADEKYQPGETAEYRVKVTDAQGEPVKAELSLSLVDKAVLTLAPEPPGQLMSVFWRNRGLGVKTAGGLTLAIDRINLAVAPEAKGGGGGGFDEGFGVIRGDFKDTALWIADFMTDANGEGAVEADLPDNLTTWTLTGKGVTGAKTLVGESAVEIVSTKPLLVRPVTPRFFVINDEAMLGMIVQNNTNQSLQVETRFEADGLSIEPLNETILTVEAGERIKAEYAVQVEGDVEMVKLTMGAKSTEDGDAAAYGDAVAFELPVYHSSTPEVVATAGVIEEDGTRVEGLVLPQSYDPTQGNLTVHIDGSLAGGMRDGLDYLEHFPYECTEQTVSRFLPNVVTYRALQELNVENPELAEKLPGLVSIGLQRLYNHQHFDGGWGWWTYDDSHPFLAAYVLLSLIEAQRAGFSVDEEVIFSATDYLKASLEAPKDIKVAWKANRQAFILYVLAEAGSGDMGRSVALFKERQKLDIFGRAYLAMALHLLDEEAKQIDTLVDDITSEAIVSATGAHWEEAQVDYYAMNTDTRSTAIVIAALSRIQPDHPLLPNAVRWLMAVRENGGHWETTQETAWAIIGLTDFMVATGELEGDYAWQTLLNGEELGQGVINQENIDETTKLRMEISELLANTVNRLVIERNPADSSVSNSPGRLYYAAYLTYYKPVQEVKALNRGIIVSRQYTLVDDEAGQPVTGAEVGDVIRVSLTIIAPNDLHYVVVEDPLPAGTEGIDTSLATTSVASERPELSRTDRRNRWGYGWWYFSHAEMRDEKAVLFATYLPKGTYEYTYTIRASVPGEFRVIPTHAEEMYFPEVFGRGDGGVFRISQ
ncbi:MAG: Ig-like domain-containing protein [Anaerolineae bacterium]|nr:Ig-like domain-containing protein [Anaerolineae bacterium]